MFGWELEFLKFLEALRTDFLNSVFEMITMLGEETLLIVMMAIIYFVFDKRLAQRIFFITATSLGVNCIVKNFVRLPRPFAGGEVSCVREETATGYSFPSGHTQNLATWSVALGIYIRKKQVIVCALILTALMGFSRMYLGAHYPLDVIVGGLLGVLMAFLLSAIYEKAENKIKLYGAMVLALTPFAVFFLIKPDALFEDFFKVYGMLAGFWCAVAFDDKFVKLGYNVPVLRRIIRVLIGIVLVVVLKEGLKALFVCQIVRISLLLEAVRYFMIVFIMLGLCPILFKKLKL